MKTLVVTTTYVCNYTITLLGKAFLVNLTNPHALYLTTALVFQINLNHGNNV